MDPKRRSRRDGLSRSRPEGFRLAARPAWRPDSCRKINTRACAVAPVGCHNAVGWRLRRNYLWIYLILLLTWVAKLDVSGGWTVDLAQLVERAAVGSVPGWLVCGLVAAFYVWLVFLTARAHRHYPFCEDW